MTGALMTVLFNWLSKKATEPRASTICPRTASICSRRGPMLNEFHRLSEPVHSGDVAVIAGFGVIECLFRHDSFGGKLLIAFEIDL